MKVLPLVEEYNLTEDEVINNTNNKYNKQKELEEEIRDYLTNEDFEEKKELNGIAFEKTIDDNDIEIKAMFYIDTTDYSYSCYITTDEDNREYSFTAKGDDSTILESMYKLVDELDEII